MQLAADGYGGLPDVSYTITASDVSGAALDAASAGLKKMGTAAEELQAKMDSQFAKIQKHWMGLTASIYAAQAMLSKAWNMAEQAAQFEEAQAGLAALGRRYNLTAEAATRMAKEASGGQLSLMESAQMAARALALGLKPDQVRQFIEYSERLSDVLGGDIPSAFAAMERAAVTGQARSLHQAGIIVDLNRELERYARQHGIAKESIDAHTATQLRANAILAEAKRMISQLGEGTESTADRMKKMRAAVKDIELWLGQATIRAAAGVSGSFLWMSGAILGAYGQVLKFRQEYGGLLQIAALFLGGPASGKITSLLMSMGTVQKGDYEAAIGASDELFKKAEKYFEMMRLGSGELALAMKKAAAPPPPGAAGEMSDSEKQRLKNLDVLLREIRQREQLSGLENDAKALAQMDQRHSEELSKLRELKASENQIAEVAALQRQEREQTILKWGLDAEKKTADLVREIRQREQVSGMDSNAEALMRMEQRHSEELNKLRELKATERQIEEAAALQRQERDQYILKQKRDAEKAAGDLVREIRQREQLDGMNDDAKALAQMDRRHAEELQKLIDLKASSDLINSAFDAQQAERSRLIMRQIQADFEKSEREKMEIRQRYAQEYWTWMMNAANNSGDMSQGMGMFAANMKEIADIVSGEDRFTKEANRAKEHYRKLQETYKDDYQNRKEVSDALRAYEIAADEAAMQHKLQITQSGFGMMAGIAKAYHDQSKGQNEAAFKVYQAMAIAETLISTYRMAVKAYDAMASIPIVGPALGVAAAAAATAFGLAQVQAIASAKPGQTSHAGSSTSAGGYAYTQPNQPSWQSTASQPARNVSVQVIVYGDVLNNHDELARKIVEPIQKAIADGVH